MRILLQPDATAAQREALVKEALARGLEAEGDDAALDLTPAPDPEDAIALAAMPGVASIGDAPAAAGTVRERILTWALGGSAVLGVLAIVAANLSPAVGAPADPLRTPSPLRPSWPLLAWYAAVDRAPAWVPVPFLFVVAALVLFFWPDIASRLAAKRPLLHTLIGVAALLAVAGLVALEASR